MFFIKCSSSSSIVFLLNVIIVMSDGIHFPGEFFEYCDHLVSLGPDKSIFINSPYHPQKYTPKSSCRYTITAPLDYEINMQCNIDFDKDPTNCTTEFFYISTEGDRSLMNSEHFCGAGYIQRTSFFRTLVIAYISTSANHSGSFSCFLQTQQQPCECGWTVPAMEERLSNGQEVITNEYPSVAGFININSSRLFCGGTIISHRYIVTAASCFNVHSEAKDIHVRVGEHNLNRVDETIFTESHSISTITRHPMYNPKTRINDIALVMTKTNIEWSFGVGPACLPFFYSMYQFSDDIVELVGWGAREFMGPPSDVLRKISVNVTSNNHCKSIYSDLEDSQMCTYSPPKDACLFDAGGPLMMLLGPRMYTIGITGMTSSCGLFLPSVHTRVTSHLNWINQVVGNGLCLK